MTKEEGMKMLLDSGVEEEEAKAILEAQAGELVTKGLQLPPEHAVRLVQEISKFGMFSGPMRFFVLITKDNEQRLLDLLNSTGHDVAVEGQFNTADISKDPIGDYSRKIAEGYAGTAGFEEVDPTKVN